MLSPLERDVHFLRRSFDIARRAMTHGNHPFGALLVDQGGIVLIEAENGYMPSRDGTAHGADLLLDASGPLGGSSPPRTRPAVA